MQEFSSTLTSRRDEYAVALPPHISADQFQSAAVTAVNLNPELLKADRRSLFNACTKAAQDGLLPDGREGAFVIFNAKEKGEDGKDVFVKKVQWLPMVYGIIKKARQSGEVLTLGARMVYENELKQPVDANGHVILDANGKQLPPRFSFTIEDGEDRLVHDPIIFGDRGPPVGVYARAKLKDGSVEYEPLNKADVEKVRAFSKSRNGPAWTEWWEEMAKKTAIRKLSKRLPLSASLLATIARGDEMTEYEQIKQTERRRLLDLAANQLSGQADALQIAQHDATMDGDAFTAPTDDPGDPLNGMDAEIAALASCVSVSAVDKLSKDVSATLTTDAEALVAWEIKCAERIQQLMQKKGK